MTVLSRTILEDMGINLDDATYAALSAHFEATLEERVVQEVIQELSPEQAAKLAEFKEANDEQMYQWLVQNVPSLPQIVSDEIDILLGEIAENAESIQ
jgi:hypothetical protein